MRINNALAMRTGLQIACCCIGFGLVMVGLNISPLFWLIALGAALKNARRWTGSVWSHGTARMASISDLLRYRLLGDDGLILGTTGFMPRPSQKEGLSALFSDSMSPESGVFLFLSAFGGSRWVSDHLIRIRDFVHLATFAPTGRGKGVSVLIPNLLTYPKSAVITDPKGELYKITAGYRRQKFGHQIFRLDPFGISGPGAEAFNPLLFIDPLAEDFLDQCRDLANMMIVRTGHEHDPHWNDSAELVITAFIAYVCACESQLAERTLHLVRDLLSSRHSYAKAVETMQQVDGFGGVIQRLGHELSWFADKELGSVLTTVNRQMAFLDSQAIARSTASSSFDPRVLRSGRASIYLCLPHDRLETLAPLMRMWVGMIIRIITRGAPDERNPVMFFLDEAGHLGKIQVLEQAVTLMRGMGIRLWFFYQSINQLYTVYGEKASTILDNIDTQQYFGVNSFFAADELSKRIGESTIPIVSRGENSGYSRQSSNSGQGSSTVSSGTNVNYSDTGRRLFKAEEIMVLPDDMALIFHRNLPVISARLFKYYDEPGFLSNGPSARQGWKVKVNPAAAIFLVVFLVMAAIAALRSTSERAAITAARPSRVQSNAKEWAVPRPAQSIRPQSNARERAVPRPVRTTRPRSNDERRKFDSGNFLPAEQDQYVPPMQSRRFPR